MLQRKHNTSRCLAIALVISSIGTVAVADDDYSFFEAKIRPVLLDQCYKCHSARAGKQEGGLLLDTRDGIRKGGANGHAIVPGSIKDSLLIAALRHETVEMPPGKRLPADVIADFVKWVEDGAADPRDGVSRPPTQIDVEDHWAYQPPVAQQLPDVSHADWPRDRTDHFILAGLDAAGLQPVKDADRRTLIRRATLELTGLPPTAADIEALLTDASPDHEAFTRVVDRLLDSPAFGIRWARHWLDVARYAESSGYTRNMTYPLAWKYRNWVIDALNADLPYDEFVRQQIAGDLIVRSRPRTSDEEYDFNGPIIATAFLTIGPKTLNEGDVLQFELNTADEQIDTSLRAFMGLTVNCARCHDHKYDPIPTRDYYALAGIFRSTKNLAAVETNVRKEHGGEYPLGPTGWQQLAAFDAHQAKASEEQTIYLAVIKGREQYRKYWTEQELEWKQVDDSDLVAAEELVQAQKRVVEELRKQAPKYPETAMAVVDADQAVNSPLFDKGNRKAPLDEVPRGVPQLLGYDAPKIAADQSGRRQLADWIVDRRNPLTSRVFVNRIWHHLFGIGLVDTVDNFGALGAKPVNQALLDDLAIRFMNDGWSIKRLIRSLVLSRTWMLSSEHDGESFAIDPGNRLNWRFAPQPLEGEAIRDGILAVSGQLNVSIPATSLIAQLSASKSKQQSEIGRRDFVINDLTDDIPHRSIFLPSARAHLLDVMTIFDAADPNGLVGARRLTTLPKQAMFLMNSEFVLSAAGKAAEQLFDAPDPVGQAYVLLLGREPGARERMAVTTYLDFNEDRIAGLARLCQVLICSGEFRTVY
jgi:hypothetical protein